ncbi:protein-tyrosine sulfotransferase 1-like [Ptychodera flava]|uniref:protein-tyrosine sulfotransferase 1-like n=1 Tax=Ptychodera flava TaxID=63121 RepID=UPI00396A4FDC
MGRRIMSIVTIIGVLLLLVFTINVGLLLNFDRGELRRKLLENRRRLIGESRQLARRVFQEIVLNQTLEIPDDWPVNDFGHFREMDRNRPILFVGGVPRSGTTLMRAMLDAHPDIRIGEETRIIPMILQMHRHILSSGKETHRLKEAGVSEDILQAAIGAYIMEVTVRHGESASLLGNKDPLVLLTMAELAKIFPNASFILMVRDGRAVVHSIITRKVTVTGFDFNSYRTALQTWNRYVEQMYAQCLQLGEKRCITVYYEQLVLHPKIWMKKILRFLKVPWNDSVLYHHESVGKPGGVSLSRLEFSTDQVVKPVNLEALSTWVGQIPEDVLEIMAEVAPMLAKLGYDPMANPPSYGEPDDIVVNNTKLIKASTFFQDSSIPKDTDERIKRNEEALRLAKAYKQRKMLHE